ncbi:MAG: methyltransferase domain-containing protein [Methanomicrobiaceae archaeon]|nr:methyltransferase domain-containing protein [Methanomicrobiaceae archaeon]
MSDDEIFLKSKKVWEDNLKLFPHTKLRYPDENLVRLMSGKYVPVPKPPAKVMDHGFGHGNNLWFLADKGYECSGCEISEALIADVNELFSKIGKPVDLRPVEGLKIPFDDNEFDIVVSWNVLHYNGTRQGVIEIIRELHRVLKEGGILVLSTVHPDSSFSDRMKDMGDGTFLIEKENPHDNRQGLSFFVAGSDDELKELFDMFSDVKTGYIYTDLFDNSERNAWYLVYAKK